MISLEIKESRYLFFNSYYIVLWYTWTLTFFIIIYFSFIDDEEACDCGHMTYHMMWGHRPRLGKSGLER